MPVPIIGSRCSTARARGDGWGGYPGDIELPTSLTINGTTVDATYAYLARDCDVDAGSWPGYKGIGETLTETGLSGPPTKVDSTYGYPFDKAIEFSPVANQKHYIASTAGFADWDQEDAVFEFIWYFRAGADFPMCKRNTGDGAGYYVDRFSTRMQFEMDDGTNLGTAYSALSQPDGWYHVMIFADYGDKARLYYNNASDYEHSISTVNGSMSSTDKFRIGDSIDNGRSYAQVVWSAGWFQASWLDSHDQDALVAQRYNTLLGK